MRLRLIENWRSAWRFASMHAAALVVVWGSLPADAQVGQSFAEHLGRAFGAAELAHHG